MRLGFSATLAGTTILAAAVSACGGRTEDSSQQPCWVSHGWGDICACNAEPPYADSDVEYVASCSGLSDRHCCDYGDSCSCGQAQCVGGGVNGYCECSEAMMLLGEPQGISACQGTTCCAGPDPEGFEACSCSDFVHDCPDGSVPVPSCSVAEIPCGATGVLVDDCPAPRAP
jgi:hypothetical protein